MLGCSLELLAEFWVLGCDTDGACVEVAFLGSVSFRFQTE